MKEFRVYINIVLIINNLWRRLTSINNLQQTSMSLIATLLFFLLTLRHILTFCPAKGHEKLLERLTFVIT